MESPELPTQAEEKQIAELIETDIDHAIEQEHIHEISKDEDDTTIINPDIHNVEQPLDIDEGY